MKTIWQIKWAGMVLLLTLQTSLVFAETVSSSGWDGSSRRVKDKKNEATIDAHSCSSTLSSWVQDDFKDKKALLVVNLPSYAQAACMGPLAKYQSEIEKSGAKTELADSEKLGRYLTQRFPQVAQSAQAALSRCNSLSHGQDRVAKTRYYSAMEKLESYSTSIVDEIAYVDSLLPTGAGLSQIECNKNFPFPKLAGRCETYRRSSGEKCAVTPEQRLERLARRSLEKLDEIKNLEKANSDCLRAGKGKDICAPFGVLIDRIQAENPWLDSTEFRVLRSRLNTKKRWHSSETAGAVKKEMQNQAEGSLKKYLTNVRTSLIQSYKSNMQHSRCLTFNEGGSNCDFQKTKDLIQRLPNVASQVDKKEATNSEFETHLEAERCVASAARDQEETKGQMNFAGEIAVTGGLMIATAGLSGIGAGGLNVLRGMSHLNRVRSSALGAQAITATAAAANLAPGVFQAVNSCSNEREALVKFSSGPDVLNDIMCMDFGSKFEQLKDAESSCMTDALLATADVAPFVKGLYNIAQTRRFSREELLALYKNPKNREDIEAILAKNGQMGDIERAEAAEKVLGKNLSSDQKSCIVSAHYIGAGRVMRTAATREMSDDAILNQRDLNQKKEALRGCQLDTVDIALLMRSGITGQFNFTIKDQIKRNMQLAQTSIERAQGNPVGRYSYSPYGVLGDGHAASGDYKSMVTVYQKGFDTHLKSLDLDKLTPAQAKVRLENLGHNEISRLSEFAAAKGDPAWVQVVESARLKSIQDQYPRNRYPNTIEGIQLSRAHQDEALREYFLELRKQASSSDPNLKKMGELRLQSFMKAYPNMR